MRTRLIRTQFLILSLLALFTFAGIDGICEAETVSYFPKGTFSDFVVKWYTKNLLALNEPPLSNAGKSPEIELYRFLWLRTFNNPVALRLEISKGGKGILFVKETSGQGGYSPGNLIEDKKVELTSKDVSDFLMKIDKTKFWTMSIRDSVMGLDGSRWILEGVKNKNYHIVDRWTPRSSEFRDAALLLLKLSKLKVNKVY